MRKRPTLPLKAGGTELTAEDLETGIKLPLYSCPYQDCHFHTNERNLFEHHISGGARDRTRAAKIDEICQIDMTWMTNRDYVSRAIAIAERERWPLLGLSTTRRSLNLLALRYNNKTTQCLACFICGQLRNHVRWVPALLEIELQ